MSQQWTPLVLRPSVEDVLGTSFEAYISRYEKRILAAGGICKIVLPSQLTPRRAGYDIDSLSLTLPRSIRQNAIGGRGVWRMVYVEQKPLTLAEFKAMAEDKNNAAPTGPDGTPLADEELERKFWKNVGIRAPLYGADVEGSLFDDKAKGWNLRHLDTLLSSVLDDAGYKLPGVNTPYLYFGQWRSVFGWHTEDLDLYSVNFIHFGANKQWYVVPPEHRARFESVARSLVPEMHRHCPEFLRHKELLLSPQLLEQYQIPYVKVVQRAREFVVVYPGVYHAGFNQGFNCAESVNFATKKWIPIGARAGVCRCHTDAVQIDMRLFRHLVPANQLPEALLVDTSDEEDSDEEEDGSDDEVGDEEESADSTDSDDSITASLHHDHHKHRRSDRKRARTPTSTGDNDVKTGRAKKRARTAAAAAVAQAGVAGKLSMAGGKAGQMAAPVQHLHQHGGMIILEDPYARPRLTPAPPVSAAQRASRSLREGVQTRASGPARMGVRERVMLRMAGSGGTQRATRPNTQATAAGAQPASQRKPPKPRQQQQQQQQQGGLAAATAAAGASQQAALQRLQHAAEADSTGAPGTQQRRVKPQPMGVAVGEVVQEAVGPEEVEHAPASPPPASPLPNSSNEGSSALTHHHHHHHHHHHPNGHEAAAAEAVGDATAPGADAAAVAGAPTAATVATGSRPKRATAGINPWRQQLHESGDMGPTQQAAQQRASRVRSPRTVTAAAPATSPERRATRATTAAAAQYGMALRSRQQQRHAGAKQVLAAAVSQRLLKRASARRAGTTTAGAAPAAKPTLCLPTRTLARSTDRARKGRSA